MEGKREIKISLSTFFLIIAIIIIAIMAFYIYNISNEKAIADVKIADLNEKTTNLQSTINRLQGTIDSVSNTINNNVSKDDNSNSNKYTEITNNLEGLDVLSVTNVIKNNKNYTLQGVIFTQYTFTDSEIANLRKTKSITIENNTYKVTEKNDEFDIQNTYSIRKNDAGVYCLYVNTENSICFKKTDKYREITVSGDIICEEGYYETKTTVSDEFKDFKSRTAENTTHPAYAYSFEFENGKCVKVINSHIGH